MTRKLFYLLFVALFALPLAAQEKKEPEADAIIRLKTSAAKMVESISTHQKQRLLERIKSKEQAGLSTEEEQKQLNLLEFATSEQMRAAAAEERAQQMTTTTRVYALHDRNKDVVAKLIEGIAKDDDLAEAFIDPKLKTLTVSATPKVHDNVVNALWQYDYPSPPSIELQFYLVKATSAGTGVKNGLPEKVHRALDEVAALTLYKGFELIDAPFIRTPESRNSILLTGNGNYPYRITLSGVSVDRTPTSEGKHQILLNSCDISASWANSAAKKSSASLSLPVRLTDEEVVVIGSSRMEDEGNAAFIVVVTAKIL